MDASYLHAAVPSSRRLTQPNGCTCWSPPETCQKRENQAGRQPPLQRAPTSIPSPKSAKPAPLHEVAGVRGCPPSPHLPICLLPSCWVPPTPPHSPTPGYYLLPGEEGCCSFDFHLILGTSVVLSSAVGVKREFFPTCVIDRWLCSLPSSKNF